MPLYPGPHRGRLTSNPHGRFVCFMFPGYYVLSSGNPSFKLMEKLKSDNGKDLVRFRLPIEGIVGSTCPASARGLMVGPTGAAPPLAILPPSILCCRMNLQNHLTVALLSLLRVPSSDMMMELHGTCTSDGGHHNLARLDGAWLFLIPVLFLRFPVPGSELGARRQRGGPRVRSSEPQPIRWPH
jgi:hypothetical protein